MRIAIYTLGCKVNQYETQAMEQMLLEHGHAIVPWEEEADAYLVNTCSVTAVSDKKSRQMIRRVQREHPASLVAVCGCYSQTHSEEARTLQVDLLGGTGNHKEFIRKLEILLEEKQRLELMEEAMKHRTFEILPPGGMSERTRAMMKVEDGCVNFCSYCIIPYARGPVRSLPLEAAAQQARQLKEEGYREIVLTGIEISSYGQDRKDGIGLIDLLECIAQQAPGVRLRLGSLEPRTITEEFCRRASRIPELCPHFHLSLQSGCDATLKRMNRKYTTERFLQSVAWINEWFAFPSVTTDLITGFPGETEEEFARTLAFLRECRFAAMHIFPYSKRPGTPAAKLPQVENRVKEERAARAAEVAEEMHQAYLRRCAGQVFPVLFEQKKEDGYAGHAPNYMEVTVPKEGLHNMVLPVRITGIRDDHLQGEIEETT